MPQTTLMKILGYITYTFFTIILVAVAGLFTLSLVPIPGNVEVKIVKSGSMEPNIHTGSVVVIKPKAEYSIGEVITFGADTKSDIPTTHRIAKVSTEGGVTTFTTKGDANEDIDPNPVTSGEVIGEVVYTIPYAGYVLDFAKKPLGFALLIVVPAASIVLDELLAIGREVMKMRRRKKGGADEDDGDATSTGRTEDDYERSIYWEPTSRSMSGDIRPRMRV